MLLKKVAPIVVVLGLAGFGYWKTRGTNDALSELDTIAQHACACKDTACADKTVDELMGFWNKNKDREGDEAQVKRAEQLMESTATCLAKANVSPAKIEQLSNL